jgi:transcriptional regulator with XRE-family HTH domain
MRTNPLLHEACRVLGLNQRELGKVVGLSTRTIQRLYRGHSTFVSPHWHTLARAAHPSHPELAAKLAAEGGTTLMALGLERPLPAPAPAIFSHDVHHLTDGVVCAAAEAIELTPRAVRPALLAAFRRAREMRLTVEQVEAALAGKPERDGPQGSKGRKTATG